MERDKLGRKPIDMVVFHVDAERMGGEKKEMETVVSHGQRWQCYGVQLLEAPESSTHAFRKSCVLKVPRDLDQKSSGCVIECRACRV